MPGVLKLFATEGINVSTESIDRAVSVPEEPYVRALMAGMVGTHGQSLGETTSAGWDFIQFWAIASVDEHTATDLACARIGLENFDGWSGINDTAARSRELFPRLWGFGLTWCGGIEVFASPTRYTYDQRLAALFDRSPAKHSGVRAMIFDPYRIAYAAFLPFGSGLSEHRADTRADTAAWVAECKEGGPIALAWAQALGLAPRSQP
ncbi:hypothetical protein ACQPW1_10860 [Nocardia sp. CA-128927]|uniref:hypothetical protein n=1 Tax=Nocardia sp. CA-128927 TaxID=3239975 RepID=UPI003D98BF77